MKTILSDHDKTLTINGKSYRVRYYTETTVVCETDELQGKFGDEYPRSLVDTVIH